MKFFLHGLGSIAVVLAAFATALGLSKFFLSQQATELVLYFVLVVGLALVGYFYKRRHKVIAFTTDSEAHVRLMYFLLGVGALFGPVKAWLGGFPVQGTGLLGNLVLLALSVPLAGASALGPMLLGGLLYRPRQQ